jgi:phospholipid/cholesterol/gamma-HCH transport system substrate-binding protein
MDNMKAFEFKVGIFILIGITILFVIVFSVGDINISKTGYRINVLFNFASGIGPSAPVRLAGVGIGQVRGIHIIYDEKEKKTRAELAAWINDKTRIEEDAVFTINTLGLLGEKYLEILPGTAGKPFLKNDDTVVGKDPVAMEKVTEDLAAISDSVRTLVDKIKKGEGTVGKFFMDDSVYKNLEEFTADIKRHPWKLLNKPK